VGEVVAVTDTVEVKDVPAPFKPRGPRDGRLLAITGIGVTVMAALSVGVAVGTLAGFADDIAGSSSDAPEAFRSAIVLIFLPAAQFLGSVGLGIGDAVGLDLFEVEGARVLLGLAGLYVAWRLTVIAFDLLFTITSRVGSVLFRRRAADLVDALHERRNPLAGTDLEGIKLGDVIRVVIHEVDDDERPTGVRATIEGPVTASGFGPELLCLGETMLGGDDVAPRTVTVLRRAGESSSASPDPEVSTAGTTQAAWRLTG
jgi:hypothetical protein